MSEFTERLMQCVRRRDAAMAAAIPCPCCGTKQVQLLDWLGERFKYRCRKCSQEWYKEVLMQEEDWGL